MSPGQKSVQFIWDCQVTSSWHCAFIWFLIHNTGRREGGLLGECIHCLIINVVDISRGRVEEVISGLVETFEGIRRKGPFVRPPWIQERLRPGAKS